MPANTPITGPHIGTWMIQSYTRENVATGEKMKAEWRDGLAKMAEQLDELF